MFSTFNNFYISLVSQHSLFHLPLSTLLPPSLSFPLILLQLFKEELTQVKEGMKHINDLAHQLAISDVHLSMENARALEHLNSRWKVLQVEFIARSLLSVWHCQQQLLLRTNTRQISQSDPKCDVCPYAIKGLLEAFMFTHTPGF